ncbi:hypothetical protein D3C79_807870 [compost metagenome]
MASAVAAIAQPVHVHAQRLQITHRRGVLGMATQQAGGGEAKPFAGGGQGVQVVGVATAQADQAGGACFMGLCKVVAQLEPLVAADQGVDQVQAQDGSFDVGAL